MKNWFSSNISGQNQLFFKVLKSSKLHNLSDMISQLYYKKFMFNGILNFEFLT